MNVEKINISIFQRQLDITNIGDIRMWKHISIVHGKQYHEGCEDKKIAITARKTAKKIVGEEIQNEGGLYAYYKDNECIYIGKATKLWVRVYHHLKESCNIWGKQKWQDFFKEHAGELELYLLPLGGQDDEGEALRKICEELLTLKIKPKFWMRYKSLEAKQSREK